MTNLNLDVSDATPASAINPPKEPLPSQLEDVLKVIDQFFKDCGSDDYMAYKNGACKNANNAFKPSSFLKSINLILYNSLKSSNRKDTQLLKSYFNSLNSQLDILDSLNLKLAEKEFVCNIIGYAINCYKNNTYKIINN